MPSAADIQARFPDAFASTPTPVLEAAIAEAYAMESPAAWGAQYELAVLYRAAHLAVMGRAGGNAGLSSANAGSVSVSFASGDAAASSRFLDLYHQLQRREILPFLLA
jgi:hypothetical protein